MRKCFSNFLIFIVTGSIFFAGCSKQENIYALPPIPQGEVLATDKKVAKPDEIKLYCDKKVVNLSQTVTEEL